MDSKILQTYNGLVLFFSERTNLFTIFFVLLLFSSLLGNFQNISNTRKIAKLNKEIASISNSLGNYNNNEIANLTNEIKNVSAELKRDNWGLYKRTITAIGSANNTFIDIDTGLAINNNISR